MKESEQGPDLTILYVEDDNVTRSELEQLLRRRVGKLLVAENGSAGLDLFRRFSPDLVITDIRMPVMDGLQMAQAIREINPEIRIIATTAHSDTSYLLEAIEIGIDHYVLKPVDINRLISSIEKCIGDINAQKELKRYHQGREKLLSLKTQELGETVIALKVLIQNNEAEREILELTMVDNLSLLIEPTLEKLKKSVLPA